MKNIKKILLLGNEGFIGRNLLEYLAGIPEYIVFAPNKSELDATDEKSVKKKLESEFYDVIINSAVYNPRVGFNKDSSKEIEYNLRIFYNFEKYQDLYGKMLYFGSGAEFDKNADISIVNEDYVPKRIPLNDYGLYKYVINKQILNSKNIINLRIFGLFGKYENWAKTFISGACCKAVKNLPITIKQDVLFDYLYIEDFMIIVKWFIDNICKFKDYNIVSGNTIYLSEIAKKVMNISEKELQIVICRDNIGNEYTASNKRLLDEMGKIHFTPIDVAIKDLYKWYEEKAEDIEIYDLIY